MNALTLRCPRDRAKYMVATAFETTSGIEQWHDEGARIVGTPATNPTDDDGYIIVELPDDDPVSATADDEVPITVTVSDTPHGRRFLRELGKLQESDAIANPSAAPHVDPPVELPSTTHAERTTDRLSSNDGASLLRILFVTMVLVGICFAFLTMGAAMT